MRLNKYFNHIIQKYDFNQRLLQLVIATIKREVRNYIVENKSLEIDGFGKFVTPLNNYGIRKVFLVFDDRSKDLINDRVSFRVRQVK